MTEASRTNEPGQDDAVLLATYGAVYVEVPKVACSSIKIVLAEALGIELGTEGNPHQVTFPAPPARRDGAALYPGLFSFAFVRNPWDRLVSCFRDKILGETSDFTGIHPVRGVAYCLAHFPVFQPRMTFERFVTAVATIPDEEADVHFRSQHRFLTNGSGEIAIDFVGRFETLSRDFDLVSRKLGLPVSELPHVQAVSMRRPYAGYYTARTRGIVANRFREDIRLFEYEFDRPRGE